MNRNHKFLNIMEIQIKTLPYTQNNSYKIYSQSCSIIFKIFCSRKIYEYTYFNNFTIFFCQISTVTNIYIFFRIPIRFYNSYIRIYSDYPIYSKYFKQQEKMTGVTNAIFDISRKLTYVSVHIRVIRISESQIQNVIRDLFSLLTQTTSQIISVSV